MLKQLKSLKTFKALRVFMSFNDLIERSAVRRRAIERVPQTRDDRTVLTRGFTLLETIVAFAVIFAALIGPVSLITRGLIDVTFAKNKLIALNLAQEGIEFVRLVRDNNVLCDYLDGGAVGSIPWNRDSSGSGTISDNPQPRRADIYTLDALPCGTINSSRLSGGASAPLRVDVDGFYQYGGVGGFTTPFRREITITMVDVGGGVMDRMDVISEVTWDERGRTRTVTMKDALYNWR